MEEIIEKISGFGKFQRLATVLIGSINLLVAMALYSTVFTDAYPKKLPTQSCTSNSSLANVYCQNFSNQTSCYTSHFGETSATEWNLMCATKSYSYLLQSFFMVGTIFSLFVGYFSDRFGRKYVCLILLALVTFTIGTSQLLVSARMFGMPFYYKYAIYATNKFLLGVLGLGLYSAAYILLFELTTSKYVTIVSNIYVYFFVGGEFMVAILSYVLQSWHAINWFIALYSFLMFILAWYFLPESPRYLVVNKRYDELYSKLEYISKINGKQDAFRELGEKSVMESLLNKPSDDDNKLVKDQNETIFGYIFKSNNKHVLIRVLLLSYIWFSLSLVYFGISLGITNIDGVNPYVIYTISTAAELFGYCLCHLNDKFSRKLVFILFLSLASIMCFLVSMMQMIVNANLSSQKTNDQEPWMNFNIFCLVLFVSLGKAMISAAYNCSYMYTSLMFSTRVRNTLLLFVVSVGKIGGITAPLINLLSDLIWKQLPFVCFSLASLLGALLVFILPDPSSLNEF